MTEEQAAQLLARMDKLLEGLSVFVRALIVTAARIPTKSAVEIHPHSEGAIEAILDAMDRVRLVASRQKEEPAVAGKKKRGISK